MIDTNALDQVFRLKDGRTLGYAELGDPAGRPVLVFHGSPGSRLDGLYVSPAATSETHTRLIVPDRPGIGLSTFQPGRALRDWAGDVRELADGLGLKRFALLGVSGGGPYAAACALDLEERLTGVSLVSGLAPLSAPGVTAGMGLGRTMFALAARAPRLVEWLMAPMGRRLEADPEPALAQLIASLSLPDQAAMRGSPELRQAFVRSLRECYRAGPRGVVHDMAVLARPWGFRLDDIRLPVEVWQGEADRNVPPAMGRYLAEAIPHARARFVPGEGHFMFVRHMAEILGAPAA